MPTELRPTGLRESDSRASSEQGLANRFWETVKDLAWRVVEVVKGVISGNLSSYVMTTPPVEAIKPSDDMNSDDSYWEDTRDLKQQTEAGAAANEAMARIFNRRNIS